MKQFTLKKILKLYFSVSEFNFVGDRTVNLKIKEKLNNYAQSKKDKDFILKFLALQKK